MPSRRGGRARIRRAAAGLAAGLLLGVMLPGGAAQAQLSAERRQALVYLLRQDCGSCHGMRLTGGLGPALTPQALQGKPAALLEQTILEGRAGTPMPPWQGLLSAAEARWLAETLKRGVPDAAR